MSVPCTVSIAGLLLTLLSEPIALHNISVLLYSDDAMTDRFLLVTSVSSGSVSSCVNPLFTISVLDAGVLLTLYSTVSVLLAVQVNSTVLPSTAAIDEGWTRNTVAVLGTVLVYNHSNALPYSSPYSSPGASCVYTSTHSSCNVTTTNVVDEERDIVY